MKSLGNVFQLSQRYIPIPLGFHCISAANLCHLPYYRAKDNLWQSATGEGKYPLI